MKKGFWLGLFLVWISPHTFADYYLKFETSGGTFDYSTPIQNTGTASTVEVSIVDTPANDGRVHWPNSMVGARANVYYRTVFSSNTTAFASAGTEDDKKVFYVAGVPRSVTVRSPNGGTNTVITHGEAPEPFTSAPNFLLPDGLLVAAGLSYYYYRKSNGTITRNNKVFMVAAPPVRSTPVAAGAGNLSFYLSCAAGWSDLGGVIAIWQNGVYSKTNLESTCKSVSVYNGTNRYIVRYD